jgi:hypothetical protein
LFVVCFFSHRRHASGIVPSCVALQYHWACSMLGRPSPSRGACCRGSAARV